MIITAAVINCRKHTERMNHIKRLKSLILTAAMVLSGCSDTDLPVTLNDIQEANKVIRDIAMVSDLKKAETLSENEQSVYLKLENTQPINPD